MSFCNKVIWSEGMFLQPQHFQQQDRYIEDLIINRPGILHPYHWGLTALKIDEKFLTQGKFVLQKCSGIFSDGTAFDIPQQDAAPLAIDITEGTIQTTVYIALPLSRAGAAETSFDVSANTLHRYYADTLEVVDSNSESNNSAILQVGKLALQFLVGEQKKSGYTYLPIAHIAEVKPDKQIILQTTFLPICLNVKAVVFFHERLNELYNLLNYRAEVLTARLGTRAASGVAEITDFMLLQLVNRYLPLLAHLIQKNYLHPEYLYRLFIQLIGELATFTSHDRRPMTLNIYRHDDLQTTFLPLIEELRRSLSAVLEENAIALKLEKKLDNIWIAKITDRSWLEKSIFVLAVHVNMPLEKLSQLFPAQSKIASVEEVRDLVNRALPGIELRALTIAPRQIPYHANYVYFSLNKDSILWGKLAKSAAIALHVGGDFPGLNMELWIVKENSPAIE